MSEEINGVKIQKIPTMGKPLSLKGTRFRPSGLDIKVSDSKKKKLEKIKRVLSEKPEATNGI